MAKKADLRAAKERKQKKIAAAGGVLLVIVLFIQVPRTLDMMGDGGEEPVAAAPVAPAATTPAAVPGAAPAPASDPESVVTATLVSFSRFDSKDPFVQQVEDKEGGSGEAPAGASSGGAPDGAIAEPGEGAPPAAAPAAGTRAEIHVNGVLEAVSLDTPFPAANPMFLLVSVAPKSVAIKVADGGSFATGAPTLKLTLGKPVTLVNTADGTRFVLLLKQVS